MTNNSKNYTTVSVLLFVVFTIWWLLIQFGTLANETNRALFSALYGVMALWGGILGMLVSQKWGGDKSRLGLALKWISLGLLLQVFGQISYSVYAYLFLIEIPYPSIGDIGYFGSIFAYIAGAWLVSSIVGIKYGIKSIQSKLLAIGVLGISVVMSYVFFIQGIEFEGEDIIVNVLNVGYPLGQSIYVAIAFIAYFLSRKLLGGTMRLPLSLLLLSFMLQYCADFVFLYQTYTETWVVAGINELMYFVAYFVMAVSLNELYKVSDVSKLPKA